MKKLNRRLPPKIRHQLKIAKQTLNMTDVGARTMGGMTKDEARIIIEKITGKKPKY